MFVFFAVCLIASAAFAFSSAPASNKAPDFTLRDLSGKNVSLKSYQGKTVMLAFFTTWCPTCREEIPQLVSIYRNLNRKNFEMLAVNIKESSSIVTSFANENRIPFPVLLDNGETANAYHVRYIPTIFIVDKTGKIVFRSNYLPAGDIEREIKKAIK
jgi:peroxiredoxin